MGVSENRTNLLAKLGIAVPIVQAPMAGWATAFGYCTPLRRRRLFGGRTLASVAKCWSSAMPAGHR